jgi:hypothetical protein
VSAVDALKTHDGHAHVAGFSAYLAKHKGSLTYVLGATRRRWLAVCELLDIDAETYNARAELAVDELLARHPELSDVDFVTTHAFAFVSHAMLAEARAKAERRAALQREVARLHDALDAALFRAGHHPDPYALDACDDVAA